MKARAHDRNVDATTVDVSRFATVASVIAFARMFSGNTSDASSHVTGPMPRENAIM